VNNQMNRNLVWLSVLVALAALFVAGCTVATPTTVPVASFPTPMPRPTETATVAPTATLKPLVWWQPELYKVEDVGTGQTYLMAPQKVVDEVIAHQKESVDGLAIYDLEEYKAALPRYYTGAMLREQIEHAAEYVHWEIWEEGIETTYEIKDFSPDGLECTLGMVQKGGKLFAKDRRTGQVEEWFSETLTIMRVRYDLGDQRWKMAETIEIIELGQ
jgi:hypothetical protein